MRRKKIESVTPEVEMDFDVLVTKYMLILNKELNKLENERFNDVSIPAQYFTALNGAFKTVTVIREDKRREEAAKENLTREEKLGLIRILAKEDPTLLPEVKEMSSETLEDDTEDAHT